MPPCRGPCIPGQFEHALRGVVGDRPRGGRLPHRAAPPAPALRSLAEGPGCAVRLLVGDASAARGVFHECRSHVLERQRCGVHRQRRAETRRRARAPRRAVAQLLKDQRYRRRVLFSLAVVAEWFRQQDRRKRYSRGAERRGHRLRSSALAIVATADDRQRPGPHSGGAGVARRGASRQVHRVVGADGRWRSRRTCGTATHRAPVAWG
mmetsp:Transcript_30856/g.89177  ORF Transcript_30856/g.89177 Transcript_30856/m.89177 type:complete len:208 (+) Transcript_30856:416-1039(+)